MVMPQRVPAGPAWRIADRGGQMGHQCPRRSHPALRRRPWYRPLSGPAE